MTESPGITLLVPEREVAYQILALNIEKAHNLRERALEVARKEIMARGLPLRAKHVAGVSSDCPFWL